MAEAHNWGLQDEFKAILCNFFNKTNLKIVLLKCLSFRTPTTLISAPKAFSLCFLLSHVAVTGTAFPGKITSSASFHIRLPDHTLPANHSVSFRLLRKYLLNCSVNTGEES